MAKLKSKLNGKRIVLKRLKPTILAANIIFKVVDDNRQHLNPWFPWVHSELKVEDSFKYLLETNKKF